MTDHLRRLVSDLFPRRRSARSSAVGVEQELLSVDATDGSSVRVERVRRAVAGSAYQPWTSFEPGGQVELSLPCARSTAELGMTWERWVRDLREDCDRGGVALLANPVDRRAADEVPLQLLTPRYLGMQRHFDRIGPAGRRMMRQTAATQVCLDWWPGAAGAQQWRLALLAGPYLAAHLSRSAGPGSRLSTVLATDPDRTGYDERLLRGDDPVAAYADLAAGACVFAMPGRPEPEEPTPFRLWARTQGAGPADVAHHLSTLFPPVRPRGRYLEVRFLDAQPDELVVPVAEALSRLLHDDETRRRALRIVDPQALSLAALWQQAALDPGQLADRGADLLRLVGDPLLEVPELAGAR